MVDADFLGRLMIGSFEANVGAVEEAVGEHADLFGGGVVRAIATHTDHCIVANEDGEFYRAEWAMSDEGKVTLSEIKDIAVPVYEAEALSGQVRGVARETVEAILRGAPDVDERLKELAQYAYTGARLTPEGVEDHWGKQSFHEADWFLATREKESSMRAFIGGDAGRIERPTPRFESMIESDITPSQEEGHRAAVIVAVKRLAESLRKMDESCLLGRQVDESYTLQGSDDSMAATEFSEFVQGFVEDLEGMRGIVSDALAIAEDGCVKCLARVHDGIAGQMYEWTLAAAFVDKLARRFEAPSEAA